MAKRKRSQRRMSAQEPQVIERRRSAWLLWLKGWTEMDIAEELGVSQGAVSKAIAAQRHKLAKLEDKDGLLLLKRREEALAYYRQAKREAEEAWETSGKPRTMTTRSGDVLEIASAPNPEYKRLALEAQRRIDRILGIDAPIRVVGKVEHNGQVGVTVDWGPMMMGGGEPDRSRESQVERIERMLPPHDPSRNGSHEDKS